MDKIVRFNILGRVTASWTYSRIYHLFIRFLYLVSLLDFSFTYAHFLNQRCGSGWIWSSSGWDLWEKLVSEPVPTVKKNSFGASPRKTTQIRIRILSISDLIKFTLSFFSCYLNVNFIDLYLLILYYNLGQLILIQKFDFRGILNLDVQTGSGLILKPGSGSDLILKPGSGSDLILTTGSDQNPRTNQQHFFKFLFQIRPVF